ncbi:MAG TPA: YceD family protein [Actinomycetes bacterium]
MPSAEDTLSRLDPRAPLVVDTHDVGRRAGTMRQLSFTAPAPAGLGQDVIGVPEGSAIELELRLESVIEGVLVSGTARAQLTGECVRCLEPLTSEVEVPIQELYYYPDQYVEFEVEDEEARRLEGELLDLEPVLRDSLVLALPPQPVCRDDCPGLCPVCGFRLADDPEHSHEAVDARWAALGGLLDDNSASTTEQTDEPSDRRTRSKES